MNFNYDPNYILLNKKYVVLENIIDENLQNLIKNNLIEDKIIKTFPWFYNPFTVSEEDLKNKIEVSNYIIKDRPQFVHSFIRYEPDTNESFDNSPFSYLINDILDCFFKKTKIKKLNVLRAKANLQIGHRIEENEILYPHRDITEKNNYFNLIYYVNTCDSNTILFDDNLKLLEKIEHKQGNILFAKGNIIHSGTYPLFNNTRCLININLEL